MEKVVLYTIPNIGHLMSIVELAKLLISQNSKLSISILILNFPFITASISPYVSSVSSVFPSISFHLLPEIPLLLKDPSNYPKYEEIMFEIIHRNCPNFHQFLQSISISSPVSFIILDLFCTPALEIARSFHIPTYFYFTSSASVLSLFLNFPHFDTVANNSFRNLGDTLFEIPGLYSVPASHMIEPMLDRDVTYDEFVKMGALLPKSDGIIINSFESLEPRAVKALKEGTCLHGSPVSPVYCIGPLIANHNKKEGNECLNWLDKQPTRSVVYLCFGSVGLFSEKQTKEIATGLEKSGVRFLWVVRAPPSEFFRGKEPELVSLLPNGFIERTKDKGFVVKSWAPQVAILAHEAVGGFVTHCGWNSTLEAIFYGIPMVAWPLYAEQKFNKIVLTQELRIALRMDESDDGFVSSDEIERRIRQIMSSVEGDTLRKRMTNLSHDVKIALGEGGSSKVTLARFMQSWKE